MNIRILGCGTSTGVPRLGSGWGACSGVSPSRSWKNYEMSGDLLFHVRLLLKPSNETVPIITRTIATVPGS